MRTEITNIKETIEIRGALAEPQFYDRFMAKGFVIEYTRSGGPEEPKSWRTTRVTASGMDVKTGQPALRYYDAKWAVAPMPRWLAIEVERNVPDGPRSPAFVPLDAAPVAADLDAARPAA